MVEGARWLVEAANVGRSLAGTVDSRGGSSNADAGSVRVPTGHDVSAGGSKTPTKTMEIRGQEKCKVCCQYLGRQPHALPLIEPLAKLSDVIFRR